MGPVARYAAMPLMLRDPPPFPTHQPVRNVQVQGPLLLQHRQHRTEEVHGQPQLRIGFFGHRRQRRHRGPWGQGGSFWLAQRVVEEGAGHGAHDSLKRKGRDAESPPAAALERPGRREGLLPLLRLPPSPGQPWGALRSLWVRQRSQCPGGPGSRWAQGMCLIMCLCLWP